LRDRDEPGIGLREFSRREVVVARAFIPQRAVDDHEIGRLPSSTIWPAEVTLMRKWHPEAKSSSATSTAKDAPTAQPTIPNIRPLNSNSRSSV